MLRIPVSSIAAASICETREVLKLREPGIKLQTTRRSGVRKVIIRIVAEQLKKAGANAVYGLKIEYPVDDANIIVAKPDVIVYDDNENVKAIIRVKDHATRSDYDKIYLDTVALVAGGIDMVTRLVLLSASSSHAALEASRHLINSGFGPGRGDGWNASVWLYKSSEPAKYVNRFMNVLAGLENPTPARSPSLCAQCPVKDICPHATSQGLG